MVFLFELYKKNKIDVFIFIKFEFKLYYICGGNKKNNDHTPNFRSITVDTFDNHEDNQLMFSFGIQ